MPVSNNAELPIEQIDPNAWYSITEIAEMGLICDMSGKQSRIHVKFLINRGLLAWRDYAVAGGKKSFYQVRGDEIIRYRQQRDTQKRYHNGTAENNS